VVGELRGRIPILVGLKQEKLRFGRHVDIEAVFLGLVDGFLEHIAWVALEGLAGRSVDHITDESGRSAFLVVAPRENSERVGVGFEPHVGLLDSDEPVDRGAIEVDALGEGLLSLVGRH